MGYKINYEKNIEMNLKANAIIQKCINALDTAEEILNRIKETEAIKCKAKSSLNGYMEDVIINRMISTTRGAIQCYMLEQVCYIFEMYEHDDSETAIIEEEHLEDVISGLAEHYGVTEANIEGYRTVADGVSDIISLYTKAPDDMGNAYAVLKEKTEKTKDIFGEYQQRFEGRSGELAEYIMECYNIVLQCSNSDISMTEYDRAYADIPGLEALVSAKSELETNIGYTDEERPRACEKYEEITTAYKRRKEGEAKVRCLSGIIIGGLSLLCPLTMTFTMPQLVVTYSLSSICVVYNTDQFLQGMQQLDAAETRNTNAEIDKMVDFHNETLNRGYEIVGNLSTIYCENLVMETLISSLKGGKRVTFLSTSVNTGKDLLIDYMAENIDNALGEPNPVKRMAINFAISGGIAKAEKKIRAGKVTNNLNAIDATDVKNAKNDIDAIDVKKATNIKEPVTKTQQGHIRSEIKTNTQTVLDVVDGDIVLERSIDTSINSGVSRPRDVAMPNSIYEQINSDGTVKSRAFYDEYGNQFCRQDFDHKHFDKKTKQYYQPHEHNYFYNENGQPTGKSDGPLPSGYTNGPTK